MTWHTLQYTDRVAVNINDEVSFKLTDHGRQLIVEGRIDGWHDYADPIADGTWRMQIYDWARLFGPHLGIGRPVPCETIVVVTKTTTLRLTPDVVYQEATQ